MPSDNLVYWDSMLFVYRIEKHPDWIGDLQLFTDAAERGELRIVTSAYSLVEVAKMPNASTLSEEQERLIVDFFENEYIVVRNIDRFVAELARDLIRKYKLPTTDAVHVATAILSKVDVLHTNDKDHLLPKDGKIGKPGLRIEQPYWRGVRTLGLPMPAEKDDEAPEG